MNGKKLIKRNQSRADLPATTAVPPNFDFWLI
jgi:hypothetical protein